MVVVPNRPFVYGNFSWPGGKKTLAPPPGFRMFAIEILREYSPSEFLGKIYVNGPPWVPLAQSNASKFPWYSFFSKVPKFVYFDMEGSGKWEILHFRNESDETGPYVAVALRYVSPKKSGK